MRRLQLVFFLFALALGTWGWAHWHQAYPGNPIAALLDALYRAIQLFLGNFDRPERLVDPPLPLSLEIARFLSPLVTVWAVIELVTGKLAAFPGAIWATVAKPDEYVVIGFGEVGEAIALALHAEQAGKSWPHRPRIVLVDRAFASTRRRRARSLGMQPLERDALTLAEAPWLTGLGRARRIFIAAGSDETSLRIAAAILPALEDRAERLWVHLGDYTLLDRLRDIDPEGHPGRFPRYFSLYEAAVEKLLVHDAPVTEVMAQGFAATHVVLVGVDRFSRPLIENLALYGGFGPPSFAMPRVTVIDRDASAFLGEIRARHPALAKWIKLEALDAAPAELCWMAPDTRFAGLVQVPVSQWIFASDRLPEALALHRGIAMGKHPPARIDVASLFEPSHALVAGAVVNPNQPGLGFFASLREAAPFSIAINSRLERIACGFHDHWRKGQGATYDQLSETMRISNWRAALHALLKLRVMKFGGVDPRLPMLGLSAADLNRLREIAAQPEAETGLGEFEHIRWCVDRVLDGWTAGATSDGRLRTRKQLNYGRGRYAELAAEEARKDSEQIEALVDALTAERDQP